MAKRKKPRARGKIQFSKYFQKFRKGDFVSVIIEKTIKSSFPERLQGKTGIIHGKRGRSYIVKINDKNKEKKFIIKPIHLKKLKPSQ